MIRALLDRFRYPRPDDVRAVHRMTSAQWAGIAKRTPTYLEAYRDRPGSDDRAQARARWIAGSILGAFPGVRSVHEIGCGAGRNLAELRRICPDLRLSGEDICPEAVRAARATLGPNAPIFQGDLVDEIPVRADVLLSVGVLVHLHPRLLPEILSKLWRAAMRGLVLVEEWGENEVVKGPASWNAHQRTGNYVLWRPALPELTADLLPRPSDESTMDDLPSRYQSPGATTIFVVRR